MPCPLNLHVYPVIVKTPYFCSSNQNITASTKLVFTDRLLVPGHYSFHFDDEHLLTLPVLISVLNPVLGNSNWQLTSMYNYQPFVFFLSITQSNWQLVRMIFLL